MADTESFNQAKNGLLRYFTSQQTALGARLIGFTVALFTLLQAFQYSSQQPLSDFFPGLNAILTKLVSDTGTSGVLTTLKLCILCLSIFILLTWLIRTIFRYLLLSYVAQAVVYVDRIGISGRTPLHNAIQEAAVTSLINSRKKLYWSLPCTWFLNRGKMTPTWKGWLLCLAFALLGSCFLVFILW